MLDLLQCCEIAMALRLCLAPTKARQMRMRVTGGSLPSFKARHHGGQKGRNLLTKQNRNTHDLEKGPCKITNHIDKHNMTKFIPARFAQHAAQLVFSVWADSSSSSSRPAALASFPAIARPSLLQLNKTTARANSGKYGIVS